MTIQSVAPRLVERPGTPLGLVERFLRDRKTIWQQIASGYELHALVREMLIAASLMLALYGAVLGLSQGPVQALVSAIKLPLLYLLTLAISLPAVYLFNLLGGGRLNGIQLLALALSAITVPAALMMGFAPLALFFRITAPGYTFYVLLNIGILALTSVIGLALLGEGARALNIAARAESAKAPPAVTPMLLLFWLPVHTIVGTQLAWTLRPFFGDPTVPFALFREIGGNFLTGLFRIVFSLLFGF